ncbi:MAG: IS1595 family transposase [Actinomycetota bacterium]|nr:IS1595 family transposase [Actinomycetota bacterium]
MTRPYKPDVVQEYDLVSLIEEFGSEDKCHAYLEDLRWPDGVECPRCESKKISRIAKRRQFDCDSCRYQFSVRVGTLFHDSKLPLWKWFLAVYLMIESKKGISANQMKRTLGVSYKTAWYLCHRIRSAMVDESGDMLHGIVEADETFIGGKARGFSDRRQAALHRRDNKTVVLGAVERGGKVRLRVAPDATRESVHGFLKDVVADDAEAIYTDSHRSYRGIGDEDTTHEYVDHSRDEWVRGQIHTNTVESVWSLFDRSVIGAYHKLSVKHLPAYLDEAAFRWNNKDNPFMVRDTILRLVEGDTLPYRELVASK